MDHGWTGAKILATVMVTCQVTMRGSGNVPKTMRASNRLDTFVNVKKKIWVTLAPASIKHARGLGHIIDWDNMEILDTARD